MSAIENSSQFKTPETHFVLENLNPFQRTLVLLLHLLQGYQPGDIVVDKRNNQLLEVEEVFSAGAYNLLKLNKAAPNIPVRKDQVRLVAKSR